MKVLFATFMILALAGCTTPHYKGGKQHKTSRSATTCCSKETCKTCCSKEICKSAVTMKGKSWSHDKKADQNTRARKLREAVRNGDMTPEEARSKAGDMRRNSNRSNHPRR